MKKGFLMTGIVDACSLINSTFTRITKRAKEEGLFTERENAYISSVFGDMLKEGNQYIEKVKDLLSPKQPITEDEKLSQLNQMYQVIRGYTGVVKKFDKNFEALSKKRSSRLTDIEEVRRIFRIKDAKE